MKQITVDDGLHARLDYYAERQGVTINRLLHEALKPRRRDHTQGAGIGPLPLSASSTQMHAAGSPEHLALCIAYARRSGWTDADIREHFGRDLGLLKHEIKEG